MIRNVRNILTLNNRICRQKNKQLIKKDISLHMKQKFRKQLQMQQKIQQKNIERFSTIIKNERESASKDSPPYGLILFSFMIYHNLTAKVG